MRHFLGKLKSVGEFKERGKTVLLRVDYNIECEKGKTCDVTHIIDSLPSIKYLLELNSRILIVAHRGRPDGRANAELSLKIAAESLAGLLGRKFISLACSDIKFPSYPVPYVYFAGGDIRTLKREAIEKNMKPGDIVVFENIRFYPEEEKLDKNFAKGIASLADIYVNEAFSVDHHSSVSVEMCPLYLKNYAGFRLMDEIKNLEFVVNSAKKPLVLVIGGAKITDKAKMLNVLIPRSDYVIVGGAMANLFLLVKNYQIGGSFVEEGGYQMAAEIMRNHKDKIILPRDVIVSRNMEGSGILKLIDSVEPGEKIVDIGPETIFDYSEIIKKASTIIWNGPLGVFENQFFAHGTLALARLIASRAKGKAYALVGGGETLQALNQTQMQDYIDFVSTGGGAILSYLGEEMPGISALVR